MSRDGEPSREQKVYRGAAEHIRWTQAMARWRGFGARCVLVLMAMASITAYRSEIRLEYEQSTKPIGRKSQCCVKRFRSMGCRLELELLRLPVGGGGRGPDGGGAGRIGRLKASPVLGRFVVDTTDVLDVRGGNVGRSKTGA